MNNKPAYSKTYIFDINEYPYKWRVEATDVLEAREKAKAEHPEATLSHIHRNMTDPPHEDCVTFDIAQSLREAGFGWSTRIYI